MELNLSKLVEEVSTPPQKEEEQVGRERSFDVTYIDPATHEVLNGLFTSFIPDKDDKVKAGRIMARLAGNGRFDDMPLQFRDWADAIAVCATRLSVKPPWFEDLCGKDDALLFAVCKEVLEHENLYFRAAVFQGEEGTSGIRVAVRPAVLPEAGRSSIALQSARASAPRR